MQPPNCYTAPELEPIPLYGILRFTRPYPGLVLTSFTRRFIGEDDEATDKFTTVHVLEVDLSTPGLRVLVTPAGGTRDVTRETTQAFVARVSADAGMATHFFQPYPSDDLNANLIGLGVSEGVVISPFCAQPPDEPEGPYVNQGYALVDYAPAVNVDPYNRARVVHHDPSDLTHRSVLEPVTLWNAFAGSAQILTNGLVTIPTYAPTGPLSVLNGYSNSNSWYDLSVARAGVGVSANGRKLILATGDNYGESAGLTGYQLAVILKEFGAWDAINTDGGGSASLVLRNRYSHTLGYVNTPQTGAPREVGGNLAVFSRPIR